MVICVSEELNHISNELKKRGYNIIKSLGECNCDVIICNLKDGGLNRLTMEHTLKNEGVLIVDLGSKNIDEIENILNNRTYSSIF
ncbi:putative Fe-Mo cluster-binding NifX family protein [Clostridium pascui]|uniref:YkuS family protein n=1 Tax=Clostridium pascui TaxID=46609 RepID=UPI001956FEDE|nr:YkuS family protein [Clostridium pascui]MBM7872176.1 putative Fe-Mo cluster-binding NifX family protein [Clostridium pascui]